METITDRIIIYLLCCTILFNTNINANIIASLLIMIIITCLMISYDLRAILIALNVVYIIMCFLYPEYTLFVPLMLYGCIYKKEYFVEMLYILVLAAHPANLVMIIALSILSLYMAVRTYLYEKKRQQFIDVQDKNSELQQYIDKMQRDMAEKQDFEIHAATLSERNRIAREIHDNVGHMITRAILQVGALKIIVKDTKLKDNFEQLQNTLNTAMNSIRESVHDLRDESFDLQSMIKQTIKEYSNLNIKLDYDMSDLTPKSIKYCLIAIIKEALTNVIKHSNATEVTIVASEHPAFYQMLIEDNGTSGKAFDKDGMGLENMRDRVDAFAGNITISNENGFRIFVSILKKSIKE